MLLISLGFDDIIKFSISIQSVHKVNFLTFPQSKSLASHVFIHIIKI